MNTSYACLDHHVQNGRGDTVALVHHSSYYEQPKESFTYRELLGRVERFAGALSEEAGVQKGDRVVIYMPMVPEAIVAMLACARLGAVHSVVFGGFASKELATRIDDARPKAIVSASCGLEPGGKIVDYKPLLDGALAMSKLPHSEDMPCFILQRPEVSEYAAASALSFDGTVELNPRRDIDFRAAEEAATPHAPVPVLATDPLYLLYTSGTTGLPKGVIRDNGGHAVALKYSMDAVFGCPQGETFFAASDLGWVVGHSYIAYAPLLRGCASVLFEGKPVGTPDAAEYWRVVERHQVHTLFTAPTALRAMRQQDPNASLAANHDLASLRALFVAGERADPPTVEFFTRALRKPVLDHFWQTEVGWPMAAMPLGLIPPHPAGSNAEPFDDTGATSVPIKPGSSSFPVPGYDIRCLDPATGIEVPPNALGQLVVKLPLPPGTLSSLWEWDEQRYFNSYLSRFEGYYDCGDSGLVDDDGYVHVLARTDDVINVAGHRLSTGQLEEVLQGHPCVAECAVVGVYDALKGEVPVGVVVLNRGVSSEEASRVPAETVARVRENVGPVAALKNVIVTASLPKTRSGKTLRRTMKAILEGQSEVPIPPTIDNTTALDHVRDAAAPFIARGDKE